MYMTVQQSARAHTRAYPTRVDLPEIRVRMWVRKKL